MPVNRLDNSVTDIEKQNVVYRYGNQFVSFGRYQEMGLVTLLFLQFMHDFHKIERRGLSARSTAQGLQFVQCILQIIPVDRFQQIRNAVDMKSPQSIFIVGSGKDDRTFHLHMLKHFKSRTVCQMNIHKHKFRHRMGLKPFDGIHNAVCLPDNFQPGRNFVNNGLQITQGSLFVFYNQCFHISGSLTMKQLFSSFTTISCLNSSR